MNVPAPTIRALLGNGPRAGQELALDTGPDGHPPQRVSISDPLAPEPGPEGPDPDTRAATSTTYHLHGPGDADGTYVYLTGHSD